MPTIKSRPDMLDELLAYCGGYGKLTRLDGDGDKVVSPQGMEEIREVAGIDRYPAGFPRQVVTRQGKLANRLDSFTRSYLDQKLTPAQLEKIGQLAESNTVPGEVSWVAVEYGIMRWDRSGTYRAGSSCFYGGAASSRKHLEELGGCTLALYRPGGGPGRAMYENFNGLGRAWLVPHKKDLLVLNIYYPKDTRRVMTMLTKVLEEQTGKDIAYYEVRCQIQGVHVNNSRAYRVSPDSDRNTGSVELDPETKWHGNRCQHCGSRTVFYKKGQASRTRCEECGAVCKKCKQEHGYYEMTYVSDDGAWYCNACSHDFSPCQCGKVYRNPKRCNCGK